MLADHLAVHRQELIQRVESRAGALERPDFATGREARIGALLDELIETLPGVVDDAPQPRPPASVPEIVQDQSVTCFGARSLRRSVDRHCQGVTLSEMVLVADCASVQTAADWTKPVGASGRRFGIPPRIRIPAGAWAASFSQAFYSRHHETEPPQSPRRRRNMSRSPSVRAVVRPRDSQVRAAAVSPA